VSEGTVPLTSPRGGLPTQVQKGLEKTRRPLERGVWKGGGQYCRWSPSGAHRPADQKGQREGVAGARDYIVVVYQGIARKSSTGYL